MPDADPAASVLDEIRANANGAITDSGEDCADVRVSCLGHNTLRAVAAVEAALNLAGEWVPHIPGDPVDLPSLGVALAMQQDCAAKLRAAITTALTKEAGDADPR